MSYQPSNPNGQATMANSAPVVIASNQSAIPITDNSGSITVDGSVTVSGTVTANAGTGTMNVSVQNASIPVTDNGGSLTVDGSVSVSNFPATQAVSGSVTVTQATAANLNANVTVQNASIPVTDNGGSLTVDNGGTFAVQAAQSGTWNINNVSGTVSLPTGAATSAKQPALGTAGTASSDVITVQGIASMTALKVDGSGVTQPVSGTVTANAGTGSFTVAQATAANLNATVTGTVAATQSGTWSSRTQDGSGNSVTSRATGSARPFDVAIVDGSGNQVTSFGGGTQYADGAAIATPTGTAALGFDGTNVQVLSTNATGHLNIADGGNTITVDGTINAAQSGTWNVGLNAGSNAIGSITNTSFAATQATAANLNATVVGTGTFAVQAAQSGTWDVSTLTSITNTVTVDTELATAAALADGASNPTTSTAGAANIGWNGTTWDRLKTSSGIDGNGAIDGTGVLAVKMTPKRVNAANLGTATNSAVSVDVHGYSAVTVSINTTTTGTFVIEGTGDNTNWGFVEVFDVFADLWVSGQSLTPTTGKVYNILCSGLRQLRIRTNATLGATVANFWTLDNSNQYLAGIDTGAAPHNFGYALIHKDGEYSTAQTGTALWTPASGKKFVVTDLTISTGGTTSAIVTLWQGASADTTYTVGTDPAIFRGEFAPSATVKPGMVKSFNVPYISTTADHILRVTTSAGITVYIQVNGYEI